MTPDMASLKLSGVRIGKFPSSKIASVMSKEIESSTSQVNSPLVAMENLTINHNKSQIRIDTVHQAKGESLDAVLYLATKDQVLELLGGVNTETGRIGYVAATRAKNLLWLGVPSNALNDLIPSLVALGFKEVVHT